jgi:glycosyltransferase involved in cell wall biosynthesis
MCYYMFYAQTSDYIRRRGAYSLADEWGGTVAHHDILQAALRYSSVSGAHLFCEGLSGANRQPDPAISELEDEFGPGRVQCFPLTDLIRRSESAEYIFVVTANSLYQPYQFRQHIGRNAFPACGILHTISWPIASVSYLMASSLNESCDALVVTSQAGLEAITGLLNEAFSFLSWRYKQQLRPRLRLEHIPLGVEPELLQPINKMAARRLLGLPEEDIIILYLGRLMDSYKADLEPLLIAFSRAAAVRKRLRLVFAGGTHNMDYPARLREAAHRLGSADRITFVTDFQFFAKPVILSSADIFVSPVDNIQETFGISILEAMAAGLPVIASDWSGYRDIVSHEESGILGIGDRPQGFNGNGFVPSIFFRALSRTAYNG